MEGQVTALPGDASPLLRGLSGQFPALQGYVATTPKDRAVTALASDRGHPLLAHWQYGIGRAVAWTSDALGAWTAAWPTWQSDARFWVQAVRWALPGPRQPDFQVFARVEGSKVTLSAESRDPDGRAANLLETHATVVTPGGTAVDVALPQQGPGLYERTVDAAQPGVYRALFSQRQGSQTLHEDAVGFAVPGSPELRSVGVNLPLLQGLAERSGGRQLNSPTDLLAARPGISDYRWLPLWPYLTALALLLFPLDVAVRGSAGPGCSEARHLIERHSGAAQPIDCCAVAARFAKALRRSFGGGVRIANGPVDTRRCAPFLVRATCCLAVRNPPWSGSASLLSFRGIEWRYGVQATPPWFAQASCGVLVMNSWPSAQVTSVRFSTVETPPWLVHTSAGVIDASMKKTAPSEQVTCTVGPKAWPVPGVVEPPFAPPFELPFEFAVASGAGLTRLLIQ